MLTPDDRLKKQQEWHKHYADHLQIVATSIDTWMLTISGAAIGGMAGFEKFQSRISEAGLQAWAELAALFFLLCILTLLLSRGSQWHHAACQMDKVVKLNPLDAVAFGESAKRLLARRGWDKAGIFLGYVAFVCIVLGVTTFGGVMIALIQATPAEQQPAAARSPAAAVSQGVEPGTQSPATPPR